MLARHLIFLIVNKIFIAQEHVLQQLWKEYEIKIIWGLGNM